MATTLIKVGSVWPPPDSLDRLMAYQQNRLLWEGNHHLLDVAQRFREKNAELGKVTREESDSIADALYIAVNLPELVAKKYADLALLQRPLTKLVDGTPAQQDEWTDTIRNDLPQLWADAHYGLEMKRALGDVIFSVQRDTVEQSGKGENAPSGVGVNVVDPATWFPVCSPSNPRTITAHQIAWLEMRQVEDEEKRIPILRVQVSELGRWRERAFMLEEKSGEAEAISRKTGERLAKKPKLYDVKSEISEAAFKALYPDIEEMTDAPEDDFLIIHIPNGRHSARDVWGRSDFHDSHALYDEIDWRISGWADANDLVCHPARKVPKRYAQVSTDPDGTGALDVPGRYRQTYIGEGRDEAATEAPANIGFDLSADTLMSQVEVTIRLALMRAEMPPALVGWDLGKQKESGEAKSLGMSTAEAATRRDLLSTKPAFDRILSVAAELAGFNSRVTTAWRPGIPKTQDENDAAIMLKHKGGYLTLEEAIAAMNPGMSKEEVDTRVAALKKERDETIDSFTPPPGS